MEAGQKCTGQRLSEAMLKPRDPNEAGWGGGGRINKERREMLGYGGNEKKPVLDLGLLFIILFLRLLATPHLHDLAMTVGVDVTDEGGAACGAVLREETPRLVSDTTCVAQSFGSFGSRPPLRSLVNAAVAASPLSFATLMNCSCCFWLASSLLLILLILTLHLHHFGIIWNLALLLEERGGVVSGRKRRNMIKQVVGQNEMG